MFNKTRLTNRDRYLKQIGNPENPLFHLIRIYERQRSQNSLVKELINLIMSIIKIDEEEIMRDTFEQPSRQSLIYAILFDKSFSSFPIHKQIINRLSVYDRRWKEDGLCAVNVLTWQNYSNEEKTVFREIWTLVAKATETQYRLDDLFNVAYQHMKAILELKDKAVTCINTYCQHGSDREQYKVLFQKWPAFFQRERIQSITIPPILEKIVPFAEKLNPFTGALAWQKFLCQQIKMRGKL